MARKRSKNKNKKISSQIILKKKKQTYQKKKKKKKEELEHKLTSVKISNKHPEIAIDNHETFINIQLINRSRIR